MKDFFFGLSASLPTNLEEFGVLVGVGILLFATTVCVGAGLGMVLMFIL